MRHVLNGKRMLAGVAIAMAVAGCDLQAGKPGPFDILQAPATFGVPEPINLLLPQTIRIHPFTGTRDFGDDGGMEGLEVRIEAYVPHSHGPISRNLSRSLISTYVPGRQ